MTQIISHPLKTIIFTITFLFLIVLLLKNCIPIPCGGVCDDPLPFPNGFFPEKPFNLEGINSQYDDYNTAYAFSPAPDIATTFNLVFSSNRNTTGGADYDFIDRTIGFLWDRKKGNINVSYSSGYSSSIQKAASFANTQYTEFGPLFTSDNVSINNTRYTYNYLLYSNNSSGNQDIKFIYDYSYYDGSITNTVEFNQSPIINVRFVNSASDDAYPTLH
ncbi:MAG: hypothetical protein QM536_01315, partial [Chitinophagaceae bacterium]|nr:hypothetical protein [Chitinophagaceae bacterium]